MCFAGWCVVGWLLFHTESFDRRTEDRVLSFLRVSTDVDSFGRLIVQFQSNCCC